MLTGTFRDRESAEQASNAMVSRGSLDQEVNVMMSDEPRERHCSTDVEVETDLGTKAADGGVTVSLLPGPMAELPVEAVSAAIAEALGKLRAQG